MEVRDFEFTTETTDAVFTEFLGKIKIGESWSQEGENWRRLIAIASHKGLTFVAKANGTFLDQTFQTHIQRSFLCASHVHPHSNRSRNQRKVKTFLGVSMRRFCKRNTGSLSRKR